MNYGILEGALAELIGVTPNGRQRFRARLKQFQRMGFPPGINVGRHAKASYSADNLFQMAVALELLQAGLSPERATKSVLSFWPELKRALLAANNSADPVGVAFLPKDIGGLTSGNTGVEGDRIAWSTQGLVSFRVASSSWSDEDRDDAKNLLSQPRAIIVNLSAIVESLTEALKGDQDLDAFWEATKS